MIKLTLTHNVRLMHAQRAAKIRNPAARQAGRTGRQWGTSRFGVFTPGGPLLHSPTWLTGSFNKSKPFSNFWALNIFITKCKLRPQSFVANGFDLVAQTVAQNRVCWIGPGNAQLRFCFWLTYQMTSEWAAK